MECRECLGLISEYVDDELPEEWVSDLENHLEGCPACRASERELRDLRREIRGAVESLVPPRGLEERIISSLWVSERKVRQVRTVWTALLLTSLFCPFFLLLSPIFAMFLNLAYVSTEALWRTGFTLLESAPAPLSLSLGVAGLLVMGLGGYLVRRLLRDIPANEVFS
ncbi:hypothetical protein CEB3_c10940 [Peptococcaceae bacterium CEB3]|nr:hypothetical protein CEB3_c10940 [Peptococcaceae bacterium CEB3]